MSNQLVIKNYCKITSLRGMAIVTRTPSCARFIDILSNVQVFHPVEVTAVCTLGWRPTRAPQTIAVVETRVSSRRPCWTSPRPPLICLVTSGLPLSPDPSRGVACLQGSSRSHSSRRPSSWARATSNTCHLRHELQATLVILGTSCKQHLSS